MFTILIMFFNPEFMKRRKGKRSRKTIELLIFIFLHSNFYREFNKKVLTVSTEPAAILDIATR